MILAAGYASTFAWMFTVADNYLVHIPYSWGHWCAACYSYYNGLYAGVADPGLVAALSFVVSLSCLVLLWVPRYGVRTAAFRALLLVHLRPSSPSKTGAYFLLPYWWNIHATNFLTGTPFTNQALFWVSAAILVVGTSIELTRRR